MGPCSWTPGKTRQEINSAHGEHGSVSQTEGGGALQYAEKSQNRKSFSTGRVTNPAAGAEETSAMKKNGFILFIPLQEFSRT